MPSLRAAMLMGRARGISSSPDMDMVKSSCMSSSGYTVGSRRGDGSGVNGQVDMVDFFLIIALLTGAGLCELMMFKMRARTAQPVCYRPVELCILLPLRSVFSKTPS